VRDTIEQFIWGYQRHFRRSLERSVDRVFLEIGQPCQSSGYLVGVLEPGGNRQALCVEPEDGPLSPGDFAMLDRRAEELLQDDPESSMHFSDSRSAERRSRWARERAVGRAIAEVVEHRHDETLACFVGMPCVVEQHAVYPVVAIPVEVVNAIPSLSREVAEDGWRRIDRSIAHAAIDEVLRHATRALSLPEPGADLGIGVETDEVLRSAVRRLTRSAVVLSGNDFGESLTEAMDRLSTSRYEQRVGAGRLLLAQRDSPEVAVDLVFTEPIRVMETRMLRKLLELSSGLGPALLTDGDEVYGLGRLRESYDPTSERTFELHVLTDGTWELRHLTTALASVSYGGPTLPEQRLNREGFVQTVRRVFREGDCDVDALWSLVEAASRAEHGTMIVISANAADEALRLGGQALAVQPQPIEGDLARHVTEIDGAVLVDPSGVCHGLGVILDGVADGSGDRSRGSRYNSATRYLASSSAATAILVVSVDGMVNFIPQLRPQISRSTLDRAMEDLRAAAEIEPVHPERFYRAFDWVKRLSFYLSQEQCDEANRHRVDHWERRRSEGATLFVNENPLVPDPLMDDSYFID